VFGHIIGIGNCIDILLLSAFCLVNVKMPRHDATTQALGTKGNQERAYLLSSSLSFFLSLSSSCVCVEL